MWVSHNESLCIHKESVGNIWLPELCQIKAIVVDTRHRHTGFVFFGTSSAFRTIGSAMLYLDLEGISYHCPKPPEFLPRMEV